MASAVTPNIVSISRLVADVVTGKLDVREVAARLPDAASPEDQESAPHPDEPGDCAVTDPTETEED